MSLVSHVNRVTVECTVCKHPLCGPLPCAFCKHNAQASLISSTLTLFLSTLTPMRSSSARANPAPRQLTFTSCTLQLRTIQHTTTNTLCNREVRTDQNLGYFKSTHSRYQPLILSSKPTSIEFGPEINPTNKATPQYQKPSHQKPN